MWGYRIVFCSALCVFLAGCLVPDRYTATLTLTNYGYTIDFIGEMHIVPAYTKQFHEPGETPPQFARRVLAELTHAIKARARSKIESRIASDTVLQISFEYASPYSQPEAAGLFQMQAEGNTVTLTSRPLSLKEKEMLRLYNIPSRGKLCVKAFGQVLTSNAQQGANMFSRCNTWELHNLDEQVQMVVKFSKPLVR